LSLMETDLFGSKETSPEDLESRSLPDWFAYNNKQNWC